MFLPWTLGGGGMEDGGGKKREQAWGKCCCIYEESQMQVTLQSSVLWPNLSYYPVYCRRESTPVSPPAPAMLFKVSTYPTPPQQNTLGNSVFKAKRDPFGNKFFKKSLASSPRYLTISYLSPSIQVIVCLRWIHFGQKESGL